MTLACTWYCKSILRLVRPQKEVALRWYELLHANIQKQEKYMKKTRPRADKDATTKQQ